MSTGTKLSKIFKDLNDKMLARIYFPVKNISDEDTSVAEQEMKQSDGIFPTLFKSETFSESIKAIQFIAKKDMTGNNEFLIQNEFFSANEMIEKGYKQVSEWPTTIELN